MKLEIENKKKFIIVIVGAVAGTIMLAYVLVEYFSSAKKINIYTTQQKNDKIIIATNSESKQKEIKATLLEYKNQKYNYLVKYPSDWYANADEASGELVKLNAESGIDYPLGGEVFWSNYKNINDFTSANKPDDFHLLGLTIYQGNDEAIIDFAKNIGISEDAVEADFKTDNDFGGSQFVFVGQVENDLRITVIFKKDKLFYVFKTAFINGDEKVTEIMQNIVKSFVLQA
jgi:hypothetical protein